MEIVSIVVEYAGGLKISEGASFDPATDVVYLSDRLQQLLRDCDTTESPPRILVVASGVKYHLLQQPDGYRRGEVVGTEALQSVLPFGNFGHAWNRDQRHQFGRFAHTLSAASIAGAIGYWHATTVWTYTAAANVVMLVFLFVILFLRGMDSMNGE
ncbi:conserved hypothetical protein [Paraburkholderia tropica]|uniref:hypothetical protein n=1 Tax=Paraburkholderia tropica TaxID=92647 RepID=UPI001CAE4FFA|nr:hypothetical protein [Paraburkholderia tropica]CAG9208047.1 conserved hypothetical protein [Paraburkholderia tropica]